MRPDVKVLAVGDRVRICESDLVDTIPRGDDVSECDSRRKATQAEQ